MERGDKLGLICEDIGCYVLYNLSKAIKYSFFGEIDPEKNTMIVVSYLVSYVNMGRACVWIDDRSETSKCNEREGVEYHILDGLIAEHLSVTRTVYWTVNSSLDNVCFHAVVLETEGRSRHKFKFINLRYRKNKQ